jgi:hypothetical protein
VKNAESGVTAPGFYYWQKAENEGEKGMNIAVQFPFVFQYLQDAVGITGYLKKRETYIHSNEILDLYETPLDIKVWNNGEEEILKSGFYYVDQKVPKSKMEAEDFKALKAKIDKNAKNGTLEMLHQTVAGAKKCKILYILWEGEVCRIMLEGARLTAWDNFQKNQNPFKWKGMDENLSNFIIWSDTKTLQDKDGKDYNVPVFIYEKASKEEQGEANTVYEDKVKPFFDFILRTPETV